MAVDPRFITAVSLEPYFVDKNTGTPLAGGIVTFFEDEARTTPKLVYTISNEPSGQPPTYTYLPLPDPVILSSVGTIMDAAGNNVALYYFPYEGLPATSNGESELYYITVTDAFGNPQFTRSAWPNISANSNPDITSSDITNELTNPQFAVVLFNPANGLTVTIPGAQTTTVTIAPGWVLNVVSTGATTVGITQNSINGTLAYPYNPPYTLTVTPGANITSITLTQTLNNNPNIWSPQIGGVNGWIAASVLLAPNSTVSINYAPSSAPTQLLLSNTNTTTAYTEFTNTTQLLPAGNPDNSNVGFVNIVLTLSPTNPTTFSNVQITGLNSNLQGVIYDQTAVNRQIDQMFNYYNPQLLFKPISSFLVGWDFGLNPAQFNTSTVGAFATGANTSNYVWDQTIVFQTTNSGFTTARAPNGDLRLTAAANTQLALVQYLGPSSVRNILNNDLSVMLSMLTNVVAGINGKVTLWYTTGASLPDMNTNASLIATLDATGKPATFNGTWTEITRNGLGDATSLISFSPISKNYGFSGWNANDILGTAANTATFFAIVVGFPTLASTFYIDSKAISLVPGKTPTIPAVQTTDEVMRECRKLFDMTFLPNQVPETQVGINTGCINFIAGKVGTGLQSSPNYQHVGPMRVQPVITFFNPVNNNAQAYDVQAVGDCSATTFHNNNVANMNVSCAGNAGTAVGNNIQVHMTADARYGII